MTRDTAQFNHLWNPESGEIVPDDEGREFTSVFIVLSIESPVDNYRCRRCGRLVFVYGGGKVIQTIDAKIVRHDLFIDYMCANTKCKLVYRVYTRP